MTSNVLKHQDDDGDLSVVAQGDDLVFICSKQHYWVVSSSLQEPTTKAPEKQDLLAQEHFHLGAIAIEILGQQGD